MKTITLSLDGIDVIFHFKRKEGNYIRTSISIEAVGKLSHLPVLISRESPVDIKDLERLSNYFLAHIDDIENPKEVHMGYHLLYEVTAYQGEPDLYFDILFSINMTEDASKAPRVYYGVRSTVTIAETRRFVAEMEQLTSS